MLVHTYGQNMEYFALINLNSCDKYNLFIHFKVQFCTIVIPAYYSLSFWWKITEVAVISADIFSTT